MIRMTIWMTTNGRDPLVRHLMNSTKGDWQHGSTNRISLALPREAIWVDAVRVGAAHSLSAGGGVHQADQRKSGWQKKIELLCNLFASFCKFL